MLGYFVVLNAVYTLLVVLGWRGISDYVRRRGVIDYSTIEASELTTPISIIVPAFDEEPVIVESVRAMLRARYPRLEVVVVNDGSRDGTLAALQAAFSLVAVERVPRARLASAPVRGVYVSPLEPDLLVIDKDNGGKADSINTGLCYARYPLFCTVDSDTLIDDDALVRLVRPFQVHPETVACGGVVRIVNGSTLVGSHVAQVATPRNPLVNIQIVEYLRAFLAGRVGWSRLNALLIISGAFGLFRRQTVIDAGGYDPTTVGEDAELVVRLHRHCRERGQPYRVVFVADPVCWTEAPTSLRVLSRQRNRWHRGLLETLWRHRAMIGRRRYGAIGLFAMPYFLVFEALGPLIELAGYVIFGTSIAMGWVSPLVSLAFIGLAFLYGLLLSFGALLIEEHAFRRYRSWRCTARLALAAVLENIVYRQLSTIVRARAFLTLLSRTKKRDWGEMQRKGYAHAPLVIELPPADPPPLRRAA
jgi:cellulose synthase/poly-beta-1,6-N-acetylglucosamine synthase-like glycosyltransferase